MALLSSSYLFTSSPLRISAKMDGSRLPPCISCKNHKSPSQMAVVNQFNQRIKWNSFGHSTTFDRSNFGGNLAIRKSSGSGSAIHASWVVPCSQIASSAFTWGTVAVLPFYTLMIAAPQTVLTKKVVASSLPFVLLGSLYAYLLYLSWTPDTMRLMFATKYWLPELPSIVTMFSSEMTLASAWIHLLAVDLFAARQVYLEGMKEGVETRHSVTLCLMFCPIGILAHVLTKAVVTKREKTEHGIH